MQNTKNMVLFLFSPEKEKNQLPLILHPLWKYCHCLLLAMRVTIYIFHRNKNSVESKSKCVNKTLKTKDDNQAMSE